MRTPTSRAGFDLMFAPKRLTLGLFFPMEAFSGAIPTMDGQERLAQRAEQLGFAALWFRDVPLNVPAFGDVGQIHETYVYLSWIAAHTKNIALATGAVVLPLRHPLHTAKATASVDCLSRGRLVLGVASGDRPDEFPAFGVNSEDIGEAFREHLLLLQKLLVEDYPAYVSLRYGGLDGGMDLLPKTLSADLPIIVVGGSRQSLDWIAMNADGFVTYPRPPALQSTLAAAWREACWKWLPSSSKPLSQSLYIDLAADRFEGPSRIHLGFRSGVIYLKQHLQELQEIGIWHVVLNLKYGKRPATEVIEELGAEIVPSFPGHVSALSPELATC